MEKILKETESKFVVVARIGGWYTLEESIDLAYGEQGSIARDDVDGYIADNQLIAERLDDTTVEVDPPSSTTSDWTQTWRARSSRKAERRSSING